MRINIDVTNPMEIRALGLKALNNALGPDGAKLFIKEYFKGSGDYTKEKKERPRITFDEAIEKMRKIDPEQIDRAMGKL